MKFDNVDFPKHFQHFPRYTCHFHFSSSGRKVPCRGKIHERDFLVLPKKKNKKNLLLVIIIHCYKELIGRWDTMILDTGEDTRKRSLIIGQHSAGLMLIVGMLFLAGGVAGADCTAPAYPPNADFTYTIDPSVATPLVVHFTSSSVSGRLIGTKGIDPIASYSWDFDDGSGSAAPNPEHAFIRSSNNAGGPVPYKVSLTVTSECRRSDTVTKSIYVYCTCPHESFTIVQPAEKEPYTLPVTLVIQDSSSNLPASPAYKYDLFRAQSISSSIAPIVASKYEKNPTFVITDSGFYDLKLTVSNPCAYHCDSSPFGERFNVTIPAVPFTAPVTTTVMITTAPAAASAATTATTAIPATAPAVSDPAGTVTLVPALPASPATVPELSVVTSAGGTGTLSVITNPAGAQVFVDDVMRGLSPTNIPGLPAGRHMLRFEKSGYHTMTVPVSIVAEKTTDYSTGLEAESGGMGIVPVIAAVLVIAAIAGAAVWYRRNKPPATGEKK
jgi:PKD repeat protein